MYDVEYVGIKAHGNSIMAALGIVQLKYLDIDNDRRRFIVIPVFNEEDNIYPLYEDLMGVMKFIGCKYEIIFINDASKDRTALRLDELASQNELVKVAPRCFKWVKLDLLTAKMIVAYAL